MPIQSAILHHATVPEHSIHFMCAVSGGAPFLQDGYLCYTAQDWLTIIGYPLPDISCDVVACTAAYEKMASPCHYSHESFLHAQRQALKKTGATHCYAIAPDLPPELHHAIIERDMFYTLCPHAPIPARLRRHVDKAQGLVLPENTVQESVGHGRLHIEMGRIFTAEHRRLWTEFLAHAALPHTPTMSPLVRQLFLTVPTLFAYKETDEAPQPQGMQGDVRLLNAWNHEGRLVATLLLDFSPKTFCAYVLGAHSRTYPFPHATDALFAHMMRVAREEGKDFIHLGLGVNEGIRRFKRKWGAVPALPFLMASWQEEQRTWGTGDMHLVTVANTAVNTTGYDLLQSDRPDNAHETAQLLNMIGMSKRQIFASFPEQRPYAMLWRLQKGDRISWIGGSAHFFCYSFERAFRRLFEQVDTVLFEGPLDAASLQDVATEGVRLTPEQQPLLPLLTEKDIRILERVVRGPEGTFARLMNMEARRRVDVRWYLAHARPWNALFTCWTAFLERKGWQQSVDLEAWHLAHRMGKQVVAMESLEEQLASLNAVPPERVVRYFQKCTRWSHMMRKNVRAYLRGDLMALMGTSAEFPTRTQTIINDRDERFRRRMRPFLEHGRTAVFVGTAHMRNLRHMLQEDGFTVSQVQPTLMHKLRAYLGKSYDSQT